MSRRTKKSEAAFERARKVLVGGRHLALPMEEYANLDSFGKANDAWIRVAADVGGEAVTQALEAASLTVDDVDTVLCTSVTGIATPSLDARLVNERAKADAVLKAAGVIASQFKVKFTPHVVTARQAGRAIVEEAGKRRSEVVMLGTSRKRRIGNLTFGKTTDFVLDHAPCEVLLNLVPKDYPTEGSSVAEALEQRGQAPPATSGGPAGSSSKN